MAAGFTLPAGSVGYIPTSAMLRLNVNNTARSVVVQLYGSSGGSPSGSAIATFTVPPFTTTGTADYTFYSSSSITLEPSKTYWLVVSGTGTGGSNDIIWEASSPGVIPTGTATSAGYRSGSASSLPPTGGSSESNTYKIQAQSTTYTLIELMSFRARAEDEEIVINWETASELDNAGFHIWRSGKKFDKYVRITDIIIPAEGSVTEGSFYTYTDSTAKLGKKYWYKLEDVDINGNSTLHGPVHAKIKK